MAAFTSPNNDLQVCISLTWLRKDAYDAELTLTTAEEKTLESTLAL